MLIGAINLLTVLMFRIDKDRARAAPARSENHPPRHLAPRRIAESDLLLLAAIGGTPGAYLARRIFRHKTRKQPFSAQLHSIAVAQLSLLAGAIFWLVKP